MIDRRRFLAAALAGIFRPRDVGAQGKVYRVGILGNIPVTDPEGARVWGAFSQGMRDLGYVEGQNLVVEHRSSEGHIERLPTLAAELVRLKPDVIVAAATTNARAAQEASPTIPIVVPVLTEGSDLIRSLARPGGTVTGLTFLAPEMAGKQIELLHRMVPGVRRVAVLRNPDVWSAQVLVDPAKDAARTLRLQLQLVEARQPEDLEAVFATMRRDRVGALLVLSDSMLVLQRARIADLATRARLPAMYTLREHIAAGGLAFYGPSMADNFRRAASYVDRILKGARPADLPVERPTRFELVIDTRAARAIGLAIPPAVLARADQVIE